MATTRPKNYFKCIVTGCRASTKIPIAKLHSFPWRDMPRAKKWMLAVGRLDLVGVPPEALKRLRVCDRHFKRSLRRSKNHKLWDNTAVPTLRLAPPSPAPSPPPSPPPAPSPPPTAVQTPIRVPKELARFLTLRETLAHRNKASAGFDVRFARQALHLLHAAPRAYGVLWRALRLPPPARLARLPLPLGTRLHPHVLGVLRARLARLPPAARDAALCLDEVQLTGRAFYAVRSDELVGLEELGGVLRARPAERALLVAARALDGAWTQPLAYYYLARDTDARDVAAPLLRLLDALPEAGVCVRVALAALGPTLAALARALGVSVESPFLEDARRRRRVPFLHDPEQLLLTLRDTLRAYDVVLRDERGLPLRASWRHLEALRREDRARRPRLLPELTRARVHPTPAESGRVHHALAALSERVGAGLAAGEPARRGTARLAALAGALAAELRAPRAATLPRLTRAADALAAALSDMRVVVADGSAHDAEEFSRALQLTTAGALHAVAASAGPLRLSRCGLRPLRRFAERAEGARGRLAPRAFRAQFARWATRHLARPVRAPGPDDLAALLARAEEAQAGDEEGEAPRAVSAGALQHAGASGPPERVSRALLREMRRAHVCALFAARAHDAARWRSLLEAMDAAFRRLWAGRVPNAAARQTLAALAPCLEGRLPCACFPRDTLCRLYARFRLRAALLAHNRGLRARRPAAGDDVLRWSFA